LPRKGTRHETSVVEIGYRHKRFFATVLPPVAGRYPHKRNCGIKCVLPQKNVATCDITVAIEHFIATFWFLLQ
jgi:hypothetical protein